MLKKKENDISWIGDIPDKWKIKKIKYSLIQRTENNNPIRTKNILSLTARQGVIPLSEKECGGNKPKEDYSAYRLAYYIWFCRIIEIFWLCKSSLLYVKTKR